MNFTYQFFYGKIHLRALVPIGSPQCAIASLLAGELRPSLKIAPPEQFSASGPHCHGNMAPSLTVTNKKTPHKGELIYW